MRRFASLPNATRRDVNSASVCCSVSVHAVLHTVRSRVLLTGEHIRRVGSINHRALAHPPNTINACPLSSLLFSTRLPSELLSAHRSVCASALEYISRF